MNRSRLVARALAAGVLLALPAAAHGQEPERAGEDEAGGRNAVAVFFGATTVDGETAFTMGADFEHELGPLFALGFLADQEFGEDKATTLMPFLALTPGPLAIELGVGAKLGAEAPELAVRGALGIELELTEGLFIKPTAALGYAGETEVVYGIAVGTRF